MLNYFAFTQVGNNPITHRYSHLAIRINSPKYALFICVGTGVTSYVFLLLPYAAVHVID